jgi:hypothetical protein
MILACAAEFEYCLLKISVHVNLERFSVLNKTGTIIN